MMEGVFARLEARVPSLGRMRSYRLKAGNALFSACLVNLVYDRIGTRPAHPLCGAGQGGDPEIHAVQPAPPRHRIGISYRFCELIDPNNRCPSPFERVASNLSSSLVHSAHY
jgi:hypothetical protein